MFCANPPATFRPGRSGPSVSRRCAPLATLSTLRAGEESQERVLENVR